MKNIEIDEELYQYIATNTQFIGESASSILRRLLSLEKPLEKSLEKVLAKPAGETFNNSIDESAPIEQVSAVSAKNKVNRSSIKVKKTASEVKKVNNNTNENVFNYINKEELAMQRGAVGRFLLILAALYRGNADDFSVVNNISGRDRLYFANSEQELADSGSSTKPRQIPESPFWVITNSNTTRKKMMLTKVAIALGYNNQDAEKIRELL